MKPCAEHIDKPPWLDHANEAIHKEEKYRDDEEVIGPDDMIQPKEEERDVEMMNDER